MIMNESIIEEFAHVFNSILMFRNKVKSFARVDKNCVFGEDVVVEADELAVSEKRSNQNCDH